MTETTVISIDFSDLQLTNIYEIIPQERQDYLVLAAGKVVKQIFDLAHRADEGATSITDMSFIVATLALNLLINSRNMCGLNNEWLTFCKSFYSLLVQAFKTAGIQVVGSQQEGEALMSGGQKVLVDRELLNYFLQSFQTAKAGFEASGKAASAIALPIEELLVLLKGGN